MAGTHPPMWQTPGKLQYYRAEMEPYVPGKDNSSPLSLTVSDEIKWQLRFPTKFAMSDLKLTYLDKVKEETEKFVQARIKHNFIRPDQALSLDLTVGDAELLISAN